MSQNTADDYLTTRDADPWAGVPPNITKYATAKPLPPYPVVSDVVSATIHRILSDLRARHATGLEPRVEVETLSAFAAAVAVAAEQLINEIRGLAPRPNRTASQAFSELGFTQAVRDLPLTPLMSWLSLVLRHTWHGASSWAIRRGWDVTGVRLLGNAVYAFLGHLEQQLVIGYQAGIMHNATRREAALAAPAAEEAPTCPDLVAGVESESKSESESESAESVASPELEELPVESIVVMRVAYHGTFPDPPRIGRTVILASANPAIVVTDATDAEEVARSLICLPSLRVAMSWPVPPAQALSASQWASRALDLVDKTIIPRQPIVRCGEHTTQLWLHAEPEFRRDLVQQHLGPLLAEGRNSRVILGETLLAWTTGRFRAPAIAEHLGVHPHTVRYRLKRINDLFGETLHDPEFLAAASILLQATVPLWKAGDESDVLEYRARLEKS